MGIGKGWRCVLGRGVKLRGGWDNADAEKFDILGLDEMMGTTPAFR